MNKYQKLLSENFSFDFTLRDFLALERTAAANTRTLLAFIRTSIGMFGAGIALLKLFELPAFCAAVGWVLALAAPIPLIVGFIEYSNVRRECALLLETYLQKCAEQKEQE